MIPESLKPGPHRVHSSYVWIGGIPVIIGLMIGLSAPLSQIIVSFLLLPLVLVVAALVFGLRYLSWRYLSYELAPTEFCRSSGIISKKRSHVPYQRIQSVNQTARPLQRLVGVCDVRIETAGGAANEAILLACMQASEVEALRGELFRRKKVLLDGGSLDEWGSATVDGIVYPSAWACIQYGVDPATAPPRRLDGTPVLPDELAAMQAGASVQVPVGASVRPQASGGNVLGGIAAASTRFRGVMGGQHVENGPVAYETTLSNKELLLAGITGVGSSVGAVFALLAGLLGYLPSQFGSFVDDYFRQSVGPAAADLALDPSSGIGSGVAIGIGVAAIALLVLLLFAAVGSIFTYGSFRLRRRGSRIEIESGLISRSFHGIDADRVQAVVIEQSFFRRLIGYCELKVLKVDAVAVEQQSSNRAVGNGSVLHPFIKLSRVPELLGGVLPDFADAPELTKRPAPVALRRAILRFAVWRNYVGDLSAVLAFAAGMGLLASPEAVSVPQGPDDVMFLVLFRTAFVAALAVLALSVVFGVVRAVLWHKGSGIGYDRSRLVIADCGFSRKTSIIPRRKIQFARQLSNPFQRMAKVRRISVRTAAGIGGTTTSLWDLSLADAEEWFEWVKPRGR